MPNDEIELVLHKNHPEPPKGVFKKFGENLCLDKKFYHILLTETSIFWNFLHLYFEFPRVLLKFYVQYLK